MTPPPMARRAYLHADANATLGAAAVAIVPSGEVIDAAPCMFPSGVSV